MKKALLGAVATLATVGALAVPALGDANNYCGTNSPQGSANGCAAAHAAGAQCGTGAASGAFGAFGPGNNFAGGANGPVTGDNNSDVCGNSPK
jgi:hypothetical protein